jgi:hypothetical protein
MENSRHKTWVEWPPSGRAVATELLLLLAIVVFAVCFRWKTIVYGSDVHFLIFQVRLGMMVGLLLVLIGLEKILRRILIRQGVPKVAPKAWLADFLVQVLIATTVGVFSFFVFCFFVGGFDRLAITFGTSCGGIAVLPRAYLGRQSLRRQE